MTRPKPMLAWVCYDDRGYPEVFARTKHSMQAMKREYPKYARWSHVWIVPLAADDIADYDQFIALADFSVAAANRAKKKARHK